MNTLYILDDEEDMLKSLQFWFEKTGYDVKTFDKSKDMMEALETKRPDLILMDVNLRRNDGRTTCRLIKSKYGVEAPVVLFSADPNIESEYRDCHADGFISKPFTYEEITEKIDSYLQ